MALRALAQGPEPAGPDVVLDIGPALADGSVPFVVRAPAPVVDVLPTCECVHVAPSGPGVWRGTIRCDEVAALVTPGVSVRTDRGTPRFVPIACPQR